MRNRIFGRGVRIVLFSVLTSWLSSAIGVDAAEFELLPSILLEPNEKRCRLLLDLVVPRNITKAQYRALQSIEVLSIPESDGTYRITADRVRSVLTSVLESSFVLTGSESTILRAADRTAPPPEITGYTMDVVSARNVAEDSVNTLGTGWHRASGDAAARPYPPETRAAPLVRTGDQVTAIYKSGAMEVSLDATALGSGDVGGEIRVRPDRSGKKLRAVVVKEGVVRIVLAR